LLQVPPDILNPDEPELNGTDYFYEWSGDPAAVRLSIAILVLTIRNSSA
jgi:hypothetical protein